MDKSVTMSVRGLMVTGLVVLGLAVAFLLGNAGGSSAIAAPEAATPTPAADGPARTVTMTASGQATSVPDELTFQVSVSYTRTGLSAALAATDHTLAGIYRSLTPLGVRRGDTRTSGLDMEPVYDYHRDGPPTLRGYHVSESTSVIVKKLSSGGQAVSAVVAAGGNAVRVSGIALQVADPDKALGRARADAIEQATDKAKEYVAATGQTLGTVMTIREVSATSPSPVYGAAGDSVDYGYHDLSAQAAVPIRGGHQQLAATVQVVWSLAS